MPGSIENMEQVSLAVRFTQRNLDYLTALAILDDTTIGDQARAAIEKCTPEPDEIHWWRPAKRGERNRKVALLVPVDTAAKLGALAADRITNVGEVMHLAMGRYIQERVESPELQEALDRVVQQDIPPNCQDL